jgi:hypothetical protein
LDPLPRYLSAKKTIPPGKWEQLLHVEGTGIALWLKFQVAAAALANNDLWLEVRVDGQSQPSVAAPARYWFPGLAGKGNFHNFVMGDRGGALTRLAMPFGRGLTISARNAGSKPISGVGAMISVQPATDETRADIAGRMRLHGQFLPASAAGNLLELQGPLRWIGLVYDQPAGKPTGIEMLQVDGQAQPGWPSPTLDSFLGYLGKDDRRCTSGRNGSLLWNYMLVSPIDAQKHLLLKATGPKLGERLVWYYGK